MTSKLAITMAWCGFRKQIYKINIRTYNLMTSKIAIAVAWCGFRKQIYKIVFF